MKNKALQKKIQDVAFDPKIVRVAWEKECNLLEARIAELEEALDKYRGQIDRFGKHSACDVLKFGDKYE